MFDGARKPSSLLANILDAGAVVVGALMLYRTDFAFALQAKGVKQSRQTNHDCWPH